MGHGGGGGGRGGDVSSNCCIARLTCLTRRVCFLITAVDVSQVAVQGVSEAAWRMVRACHVHDNSLVALRQDSRVQGRLDQGHVVVARRIIGDESEGVIEVVSVVQDDGNGRRFTGSTRTGCKTVFAD